MAKDIINFDAIKLTTELNKYNRHKAIPNTFFDGTYTILDVRELYHSLSKKAKRIADDLIEQYNVDVKQSEEGLYKSFLNEYKAYLRNQHTRQEKWMYPPVMKKYRANINPVRASNKELLYDIPISDSFNLPLKTMRQ